ncbi:hypothetical protein BDF19DRAFT_45948, partial [Syncephalis fuscata]
PFVLLLANILHHITLIKQYTSYQIKLAAQKLKLSSYIKHSKRTKSSSISLNPSLTVILLWYLITSL